MPFRKFLNLGPKPEEPLPYGPQTHGANSSLSPMFRPSSSSPPASQPWQAPMPQGQWSNDFAGQAYFPPPPGNSWQAPIPQSQPYNPAPNSYYSPQPQHHMNNTACAPPTPPAAVTVPQQSPPIVIENQVSISFNFLHTIDLMAS